MVRSLSACQGALLLVDASQGVQAQTLSTAKAAQAAGLKLLPVVTKIDLPHANVEVRAPPRVGRAAAAVSWVVEVRCPLVMPWKRKHIETLLEKMKDFEP